jgi:hypothetical protein
MPDIEHIRGGIERMRTQVHRQRGEIKQLQRAGNPRRQGTPSLIKCWTRLMPFAPSATGSRKRGRTWRLARQTFHNGSIMAEVTYLIQTWRIIITRIELSICMAWVAIKVLLSLRCGRRRPI